MSGSPGWVRTNDLVINRELINIHNIFIIIILHFYYYANITPQRISNVKIYARFLSFLVLLLYGNGVPGLSGLKKFGMLADKLQKAGRRTTRPPLTTFPFNQR